MSEATAAPAEGDVQPADLIQKGQNLLLVFRHVEE